MASTLKLQTNRLNKLLWYGKGDEHPNIPRYSSQPTAVKVYSAGPDIRITALFLSLIFYVFFQLVSLCGIRPIIANLAIPTTPLTTVTRPATRILPRGSVHPLLYTQNLSHSALHSPPFCLHITSLFVPRTVAIAGVEFGADMANYAAAGYKVHAVEPGERFIKALREKIATHPEWDVQLHPYAATNESNGTLAIGYQKKIVAKSVPTRRLDGLVHERLALLSADVQGGELEILQGASGLIPKRVDSVLVEIASCKPKVKTLLELLDNEYVLFDFVPWGHHKRQVSEFARSIDNYVLDHGRPGAIPAYYDWLCGKKKEFKWIQTDILAVRRDLVSGIWKELGRIGDTQCRHSNVNCRLREILVIENILESSSTSHTAKERRAEQQ